MKKAFRWKSWSALLGTLYNSKVSFLAFVGSAEIPTYWFIAPTVVQHQFSGNLYGHSQSGTKAACKRSSGVRAASFFALAITFPPSEHEAHAQHFSADRPLPPNLQSLPRRFLQGQGDRHNPRWSRRGSSQGQDYRPDSWQFPHE